MKTGIFIISLDFELHWGGFEKWPLESYKTYFLNTRKVIPKMLALFAQSEVHVTWATVGMLFHESREYLLNALPEIKPSYQNPEFSAYNYINLFGIGKSEEDDPYHFADSLIRKVLATPFQELGSHTFAHYYCNEPGQTAAQFKADLRAAQQSAAKYGKTLRSLVFPRNQVNEEYLRVCHDEGFISVRENPRDWFWKIQTPQDESLWKRLNRGLDAYLPIGKKNTYTFDSLVCMPGLPITIPASRLLRPYRPKELFLNKMKISRIKFEIEKAAKRGEIYHLWWHPHNFGNFPHESLQGLIQLVDHFSLCRDKYGMRSLSMGEVAEERRVLK